jgi:hypothetical protein
MKVINWSPNILDSVIDKAISLADLITDKEIEQRPLKKVLEEHFTNDPPTWEDLAVAAETVRFLLREEEGDKLAIQVVLWLVKQQVVRKH